MEKRQEGIREQMETAAREKQDAIQFKAEYDEKIKNPNSKISKRCCDFKLLENKCREYIKRSEKL